MLSTLLQSRRVLYGAAIILWLVAGAGALVLYLTSSLRTMQLHFHHAQEDIQIHLLNRLVSADTVLDSFAAFHADADLSDQARTRRFARQMLARTAHVQALQVYRDSQPEFAGPFVVSFSEPQAAGYWQPGQAVPVALPANGPVALAWATAVPDGSGALMIWRVADAGVDDPWRGRVVVGALLRSDGLHPAQLKLPAGMRVSLRWQDGRHRPVFVIGQLRDSWPESWLLPRLQSAQPLQAGSDWPFVLECQWQLGWQDLDLPVVGALLVLAASALLSLLLLARRVHGHELQRAARESRLYDLAHHDPLTGLYNRYYLERRLRQAIDSHRRDQSRFAVVFVDLDRFKPINDRYGHEVGDEVLQVIAARLKNVVRQCDTVARIGGDEFVLLFEQVSHAERIRELSAALHDALAQAIRLKAGVVSVGASSGTAFFPEDGESVEQLLLVADKLMYAAKTLRRQQLKPG